jgi:ionotropic glutamate receptor NMDA 1/ionotropic glutamate receptor
MLHPAARIFTLVNVVGISTELGYWTEGYGFSKTVGANIHYNKSITVLRQIIWPGGPWSAPRGWASAAGGKRLKIVVPSGNSHKEFVKVSYDGPGGSIRVTGFVIDVFNATLSRLPYALPCDFTGYDGSYDALVYQVYNRVTVVFNIFSLLASFHILLYFEKIFSLQLNCCLGISLLMQQ